MAKRVKSIIGWSSGISISEDDDEPDRVIFSLLPLLSITTLLQTTQTTTDTDTDTVH